MSIGKAKNISEKKSFNEISERARILKDLTGKSLNMLAVEAGVSNGTADEWSDKMIEKPTRTVSDFLRHHSINEVWWKTGKGDIYLSNITDDKKLTDYNKKPMEPDFKTSVQELMEDLRQKYRLTSLEQIQKDIEQIQKDKQQIELYKQQIELNKIEMEKKNSWIDRYIEENDKLHREIELLKSQALPSQKGQQNP